MSSQALPPAYQKAIARLTAENKQLKRKLIDEAAADAEEIRQLRAQLYEGLSPELQALSHEVDRWRDRALRAEGRLVRLLRETGR